MEAALAAHEILCSTAETTFGKARRSLPKRSQMCRPTALHGSIKKPPDMSLGMETMDLRYAQVGWEETTWCRRCYLTVSVVLMAPNSSLSEMSSIPRSPLRVALMSARDICTVEYSSHSSAVKSIWPNSRTTGWIRTSVTGSSVGPPPTEV